MFYAIILLCYFVKGVELSCSDEDNARMKLKNDILCGYDIYERPVKNHQNSTNVSIQMALKSLSYDMHESSLSVNSWLVVMWKDEFLTWNPDEHDGITEVTIKAETIWKPDLSIYNRVDQSGSASVMEVEECTLKSFGGVMCVPPSKHSVMCVPDLAHFPFDEQKCEFTLGSWVHKGEAINITFFRKDGYELSDFEDMGEWELVSVNGTKHDGHYDCCPNSTFPTLTYEFHIKRHSGLHASMTLVPALVMMMVTLVTFCTDVRSYERIVLVCCNILAHLLQAHQLYWILPNGGPKQPLLMIYTKNSLVLSAFTLILTVFQRNLIRKSEPPPWISSIAEFALNNKIFTLMFFIEGDLKKAAARLAEEDTINIINNSEGVNQEPKSNDWLMVAKILDRLCFVGYSIIYLWMYMVLVP